MANCGIEAKTLSSRSVLTGAANASCVVVLNRSMVVVMFDAGPGVWANFCRVAMSAMASVSAYVQLRRCPSARSGSCLLFSARALSDHCSDSTDAASRIKKPTTGAWVLNLAKFSYYLKVYNINSTYVYLNYL